VSLRPFRKAVAAIYQKGSTGLAFSGRLPPRANRPCRALGSGAACAGYPRRSACRGTEAIASRRAIAALLKIARSGISMTWTKLLSPTYSGVAPPASIGKDGASRELLKVSQSPGLPLSMPEHSRPTPPGCCCGSCCACRGANLRILIVLRQGPPDHSEVGQSTNALRTLALRGPSRLC
jgi:hypothetical protein